ncbi:MAG TPA: nodulation protein NfeD [Chitinophagaceae bacterium]|nr:nodulation protein NfeD [Chitinophagaceae bacterium]
MKRFFLLLTALFSLPLLLRAQSVVSLTVDQAITPVSAEFILRGIQKAETENATCLLIHLNTPGGLGTSMRKIAGGILGAKVPVVVYVSPAGARAGSAGVFITLAANIAAMAPGTNIGASHPVSMGSKMDSTEVTKVTNDATAFIRTIARERNRNVQWAEAAVRNSVSITETEALQKNVINLIAANTGELLRKIDGDSVRLASGTVILHTRDAHIETMEMGLGEKVLVVLSDPNIMYILLLLGMFGILFEFFNPGAIIPGIVGVICLILSFYAMSVLPINYAGLALIIFAIVLFLLEIKITSHGILALGGVVSLLLGSLMLIRTGPTIEYVRISRSVIFTAVVFTTLFFLFVIGMGLKAQRARPRTGEIGMAGETGVAIDDLLPFGKVHVHGEIWNAESVNNEIIKKGQRIRVTGIKGLKLFVERTLPGPEESTGEIAAE